MIEVIKKIWNSKIFTIFCFIVVGLPLADWIATWWKTLFWMY